jgi:hypothetical protein
MPPRESASTTTEDSFRDELRPRSIGEIFDAAFDLYKRNFALFAGVTAVVHVPSQIAYGALLLWVNFDRFNTKGEPTAAEIMAIFAALGVIVVALLVYQFIYIIQSGALAIAVSERLLGRDISIGDAYRRLFPALGKLFGAWILVYLLLIVCNFVLGIIELILAVIVAGVAATAAGSTGEPGAVVTTIIVILLVVIPILTFFALLTVFGVFTTQAVVIEGNGATAALSRNWSLLRGRFWQPFWTAVVLALIVIALHLALVGSVQLILGLVLYSWFPLSHVAQTVIEASVSTVISLFIQPFVMVSLTVLYFDQRTRREGFDIDLAIYERETRVIPEAAA